MVAVLTVTALLAASHHPHPIYGEMPTELPEDYKVREDARVLLKIPYDTILQGEMLRVLFVGIQNFTDTPIKLMPTLVSVARNQVYYQARSEPGGKNLTKPENIPFWEKLTREMEFFGYEDLKKKILKYLIGCTSVSLLCRREPVKCGWGS